MEIQEENEKNLRRYLSKGEGEQIEFKQTLNDEFKIAKTLCSMANTRGGVLLIGVRDNKTITGVDPEEEKYFLEKAAQFHCKPPVPLKVEELFIPDPLNEGKEAVVVKVTIKKSNLLPHYAKNKTGKWIPYLRQKDKTIRAGAHAIKLMSMNKDTGSAAGSTNNEKRLLDYLEKYERITLRKYSNLVNITLRRARRELNEALEKGIVRIIEHEKEDYYVV